MPVATRVASLPDTPALERLSTAPVELVAYWMIEIRFDVSLQFPFELSQLETSRAREPVTLRVARLPLEVELAVLVRTRLIKLPLSVMVLMYSYLLIGLKLR